MAPVAIATNDALIGDGRSPLRRSAIAPFTKPAIDQLRLDDLRVLPPDRLRDEELPDDFERFEPPLLFAELPLFEVRLRL